MKIYTYIIYNLEHMDIYFLTQTVSVIFCQLILTISSQLPIQAPESITGESMPPAVSPWAAEERVPHAHELQWFTHVWMILSINILGSKLEDFTQRKGLFARCSQS